MENRVQNVESYLNVEEVQKMNNVTKAKEKFKELVKKVQEMRNKELIEMHPNYIKED